MKVILIGCIMLADLAFSCVVSAGTNDVTAGATKQNNLVSTLFEISSAFKSGDSFAFTRSSEGWVFISAKASASGRISFIFDREPPVHASFESDVKGASVAEAVRYLAQGEHHVRVECGGGSRVEHLVVKAIPELIHCGLGFDPAIKSYGRYDLAFLKKDVLPNITTLIVPHNIALPQLVVDDWHQQGKKFVGEVGIDARAKTADDHFQFWTGFLNRAPFLDGLIVDEFIMNRPSSRPNEARLARARQRHELYEAAIRKIRADARYQSKTLYAYFGGSANKFNSEEIGTKFVRTLIECKDRIALERYVFERSSQKASNDALQALMDGIADWEAHEPGVKRQMVIAFGLFSMPPGGINKLPNVDYHVWMDQQMNLVANHPAMSGIGGLEWWTSILADEETVRFVGKLYRHYAIEGRTEMLTSDPLFLPHLQNADFEKGAEGWTLHPAEAGSIQARSFARYGRIEGRYMGLGRPADPEHIGDTFLCMTRTSKGPNTFSQTVKKLQPGRLYSLKMFSCDYHDLANPKTKKQEEASPFLGKVDLEGVDLDTKRSFTEIYASSPEPRIPVWITYHWKVFRAKGTTARLTVSDWPNSTKPLGPFGLEQTFNFLELEPYHE